MGVLLIAVIGGLGAAAAAVLMGAPILVALALYPLTGIAIVGLAVAAALLPRVATPRDEPQAIDLSAERV